MPSPSVQYHIWITNRIAGIIPKWIVDTDNINRNFSRQLH